MGRTAAEAGAARSEETAAEAAWSIQTMKAGKGERTACPLVQVAHCARSKWGLKPSLGTHLLSCISWCRTAFAGEVPVCNLQHLGFS